MSEFTYYNLYREEMDVISEIMTFEAEILDLFEAKKTHPGKGIPEKKKSEIVKRAKRGEKIFHGGFDKIEKKAGKRYGSEEAGKRVAAAIMWKKVKGKMTKEDVDDLLWILEDDIKVFQERFAFDESKWIQKAHLKKGRCTPAPNPDCPTGSRQYALAMRFKHGDLHDK